MRARTLVVSILLAWLWALTPVRLLLLSADSFLHHPGMTRVETGNDAYWKVLDLSMRMGALGWDVGFEHPLDLNGLIIYGVTDPTRHTIRVDSALSWDARYAVLAHEAGHTLAPPGLSYPEHECFAEAVAYVYVGDRATEHGRYLSSSRWTCLGLYLSDSSSIYAAVALLKP